MMPIPEPGTPAPAPGAIDFTALNERAARTEWQGTHMAWLNANGLSWTHDAINAWYSRPDRDRPPMPGVIAWQRRISQHYSRNPDRYAPPLDARAAREIQALRQENQALRQARQGDA